MVRVPTRRIARLGAAAAVLFGSSAVLAQSVDPCQEAYQQAFAKVSAERTESEAQYQKDRIGCGNDINCVRAAQLARLDRERRINIELVDIDTKRSLCQLAWQTPKPTGDPCKDAYQQAGAKALAERILSEAQYKKDRLNCRDDPGCVRTAQQARLDRERQIAKGSLARVFSYQGCSRLLGYAQTILQAAGRISKANTDAMDPTKHKDVGIRVMLNGYLGAVGKMLGMVATQFRALAATGSAAVRESETLTIAKQAASEARDVASQATRAVSEFEGAGTAPLGCASCSSRGYLDDAVILSREIHQGALPTCAVLSCHRLAGLLGRNTSIFQVFDRIRPKVSLTVGQAGRVEVAGGLTAPQVSSALQSIGIRAQVQSGLTNLMNDVRAGRPLIAGVKTMASRLTITPARQASSVPTIAQHAVVVEGLETRARVLGLKIYDPTGFVYWQPLSTFSKYFDGVFVRPL